MTHLATPGSSRASDYKRKPLEQHFIIFHVHWLLFDVVDAPDCFHCSLPKSKSTETAHGSTQERKYDTAQPKTVRYPKITSCSVTHHSALASGKPFVRFIVTTFTVTCVVGNTRVIGLSTIISVLFADVELCKRSLRATPTQTKPKLGTRLCPSPSATIGQIERQKDARLGSKRPMRE